MSNECVYCNSKMLGKPGKRVCSNISCRAYEVDTTNPDSYGDHLTKEEYNKRLYAISNRKER